VYDQFVARFNSEMKHQSNDIKKRLNLIYNAILPLNNQYINFKVISRWFDLVSLLFVFSLQN
jgi:hypothetical protein